MIKSKFNIILWFLLISTTNNILSMQLGEPSAPTEEEINRIEIPMQPWHNPGYIPGQALYATRKTNNIIRFLEYLFCSFEASVNPNF